MLALLSASGARLLQVDILKSRSQKSLLYKLFYVVNLQTVFCSQYWKKSTYE